MVEVVKTIGWSIVALVGTIIYLTLGCVFAYSGIMGVIRFVGGFF